VVALALGASAIAVTWLAVSGHGHRFVQISSMHGHILDSRTGCVWIMTLRPPAKVCPGDTPVPVAQTSAPLTPDEFMAAQAAAQAKLRGPASFVPDPEPQGGTASLSDIIPCAPEPRDHPAPAVGSITVRPEDLDGARSRR